MRIAFCRACACMAEKLANQKKARAIGDCETGERVPQVVNAQAGQIGFGTYLLKNAPQPDRMALTACRREDELGGS
jgi:hypothetical protein